MQKLVTKEILKKFEKYPIYSQDGKGNEAKVLVKFFNPYGCGTWLVTEASFDKEANDWDLYGLAKLNDEWEWGYLGYLKEFINLRVPTIFGVKMPIERDQYIGKNPTVKDFM